MSKTEIRVNRRLTKAYINQTPTRVFFIPYTKREDDGGGWVYERGVPRVQEKIRLIEAGSDAAAPVSVRETLDGSETQTAFQIVAEYTSSMAEHDRFWVDGVEYEVIQIWPYNGWEKRGLAIRRGEG